jgi:hypothetical protein
MDIPLSIRRRSANIDEALEYMLSRNSELFKLQIKDFIDYVSYSITSYFLVQYGFENISIEFNRALVKYYPIIREIYKERLIGLWNKEKSDRDCIVITPSSM